MTNRHFRSLINCYFINNDNIRIPEFSSIDGTHYNGLRFDASIMMISIENTTISNNTGWYDAVLLFDGDEKVNGLYILIENSIVANNTLHVSEYYKRGIV